MYVRIVKYWGRQTTEEKNTHTKNSAYVWIDNERRTNEREREMEKEKSPVQFAVSAMRYDFSLLLVMQTHIFFCSFRTL